MRIRISDFFPEGYKPYTPEPGLVGTRPDMIVCDDIDEAAPYAHLGIEALECIREGLRFVSDEAADKFFDDHIRHRFVKSERHRIRDWFEKSVNDDDDWISDLEDAVVDSLAEDSWAEIEKDTADWTGAKP
jgi:hypothetical protein